MTSRLVLPRRAFLKGLIGLIAAPAIVRATSIMPVKPIDERVYILDPWDMGEPWKPLFWRTGGDHSIPPLIGCSRADVERINLADFGLPSPNGLLSSSEKCYWNARQFPLEAKTESMRTLSPCSASKPASLGRCISSRRFDALSAG
jgi:hypothetical protein